MNGVLPRLRRAGGFSLLEMTLVLLLAGLLLGGLLMPYASSLDHRQRQQTEQRLQSIQESLYGYALAHGRLPCPDCRFGDEGACRSGLVGDGVEDRHGTECANPVGNLPWTSLGVPATDAWGNRYTYRVSAAFSRSVQACQPLADCQCSRRATAFTLCDIADLSVGDGIHGTDNVGRELPAVVVAHGANRLYPEQDAAERENYEGPLRHPQTGQSLGASGSGREAYFVYRTHSLRQGEVVFDDLLTWLSPYVLKNRMIQAGRLP